MTEQYTAPQEKPALVKTLEATLQSSDIAELPAGQQGQVIMDRFVGALFRTGSVETVTTDQQGKKQTEKLTPVESLRRFQPAIAACANGDPKWSRFATRKAGIRDSLVMLEADGRTTSLVAEASARLRYPKGFDQSPTLASLDQLSGYLDHDPKPDSAVGKSGYAQTILDEVAQYASTAQNPERPPRWQLMENLGSDVASVRQDQLDWQQATETAHRDGVDMSFVIASAESMHRMAQNSEMLGDVATTHAISSGIAMDRFVSGE